ncbi:MAG: hypothetical protein PHE73_08830 [Sulfurovaceae bacterium]|nr:hypothetical protein [Sulfurovaceae bacterium]
MAVLKDATKGKNFEGSHFGGEGKDKLTTTKEFEYTGVYKSGPNPKLNVAKGYTSQHDGKEEGRSFSGLSQGYASPQRTAFKPKDLGVRHPDTLEHS